MAVLTPNQATEKVIDVPSYVEGGLISGDALVVNELSVAQEADVHALVDIAPVATVVENVKSKTEKSDAKLVKIKVLKHLSGRFLLPHDPGAVIKINDKQAAEIVDSGYGEYLKK